MENDINREINIEQVEFGIDIDNIEYSIEINPRDTFAIELNEQGPQGARGYTGNGIESYVKTSTVGLIDTYTITFTDGNTTTVDVTNGRGITSITGPVSVGNVDTYTINYNDSTTSTFTVTNGIDGVNPTVTVGTTTTGNPGTSASVTNVGTTQDVILDFTIPRGDKGDTGTAATITVGTVTTGLPTDPASVTNVGTSGAAIFNFTIPKGETGSTGATGNGIVNIEKASTVGLVDTYHVNYTNGNYDSFTVTNGRNGEGSVADVTVNGVSVLDGSVAKVLVPTDNNQLTNGAGYITNADLPTNHVTTDTAQSISGQKTFTSTIKSSVNNSLVLTQSTGEAFGVTVTKTDANNEISFGIGQGGDNRGIWDTRFNKWAFNIANNGKAYALGNEIAIKSDLNNLSPLRYSKYSIAQVNSTNKFIKLASMEFTQSGNRDFSYLFWVEILEASVAKCYALVRLSARWNNTSYSGHKFEILEKYGDPAASLEALKNLTYAYSLDTTTHKMTAEIWLEIRNINWVSYYLRPTEYNEYGDYSNTPVTLSNNIWTYYNQSGNASSIASTAITSGLTQVKVTDATGVRNENNLSQVIKTWTGTKAQYDAIITKDANTLYNITDDTDVTLSLLELLYPVGSIYIGTMVTCPLQTLGVGTWQLVASDRVLQGAGTRGSVGDMVSESLPNITGNFSTTYINGGDTTYSNSFRSGTGAFKKGNSYTSKAINNAGTTSSTQYYVAFDASLSNSTYQNNAPVQQDAYLVNIWERIS